MESEQDFSLSDKNTLVCKQHYAQAIEERNAGNLKQAADIALKLLHHPELDPFSRVVIKLFISRIGSPGELDRHVFCYRYSRSSAKLKDGENAVKDLKEEKSFHKIVCHASVILQSILAVELDDIKVGRIEA